MCGRFLSEIYPVYVFGAGEAKGEFGWERGVKREGIHVCIRLIHLVV